MPAFEYVVLNDRGKQSKGTLEGDSARQVRQQLREKGLTPISVDATVKSESHQQGGSRGQRRFKLNTMDLSVITRQMAILIQAGLPVEEALKAIAKQTEKPKIKSMILSVRSQVLEGHTLAHSLQAFPRAFPDIYRATVAAGEKSAHLDLVLNQLADYTESSHDTQKKVSGALVYPIVLVLFSVLIVVGLLKYIIPKMVTVFEDSDKELPALTEILINASDFIQSYGLLMLMLIIGLIFLFRYMLTKPAFKRALHVWLLKLPLIGRLIRLIDAARVANTLSILSKSGVQLVDALKIAGEVTSNVCIRRSVLDAATALKEGASLHRALEQSGYFPPLMIQMIASGESSGELDSMLGRAAKAQERELSNTITTIVGLFEPLMMVVMGVIVLSIVMAIMLPVFSMNDLGG